MNTASSFLDACPFASAKMKGIYAQCAIDGECADGNAVELVGDFSSLHAIPSGTHAFDLTVRAAANLYNVRLNKVKSYDTASR